MAKKTSKYDNAVYWAQAHGGFLKRLRNVENRLERLQNTRNHSSIKGESTKLHSLFDSNGRNIFMRNEYRTVKKRLRDVSKKIEKSNLMKSIPHKRTLMNVIRRRQRVNVEGHVVRAERYLKNILNSIGELQVTAFHTLPTKGPYAAMTQTKILPRYKLANFSRLRWSGGNVGQHRGIRVVTQSSSSIASKLDRFERSSRDIVKHALFRDPRAMNRVARCAREITERVQSMRTELIKWNLVDYKKRLMLQRIYKEFATIMFG